MSGNPLATPKACLERAVTFKSDAEQLLGIGNQWFAVAYFYAGYHIVRASLIQDPVFKDLARLHAVNPTWAPEDRFNTHHTARRAPGHPVPPGVRDMVNALYLDVQIEYARLHSASVAVRYDIGLDGYDPAVLANDFSMISAAAMEGRLVAP